MSTAETQRRAAMGKKSRMTKASTNREAGGSGRTGEGSASSRIAAAAAAEPVGGSVAAVDAFVAVLLKRGLKDSIGYVSIQKMIDTNGTLISGAVGRCRLTSA